MPPVLCAPAQTLQTSRGQRKPTEGQALGLSVCLGVSQLGWLGFEA